MNVYEGITFSNKGLNVFLHPSRKRRDETGLRAQIHIDEYGISEMKNTAAASWEDYESHMLPVIEGSATREQIEQAQKLAIKAIELEVTARRSEAYLLQNGGTK